MPTLLRTTMTSGLHSSDAFVREAVQPSAAEAPPGKDTTSILFPLSFGQQRLWFLDQLEPGNSAYNSAGGVRFRGKLNVDALQRALNEIVARHEILRTTF